MSITVTATQSGAGAFDGLALTVKVVRGQAASPIGTVANSGAVTAPELAITPAATGSFVYGAVYNVAASTAYTAAANTTFSQNVSDTTNAVAYGTFRLTATTTSGTPATVGGTAPTEATTNLSIALLEIKAGTGLAEDASSPAGVNTKTAETLTTASFTPPPGSLLVAQVAANSTGDGTNSMAITLSDSSGLTWTKRVAEDQPIGSATYESASIWTAIVPAATRAGAPGPVCPVRPGRIRGSRAKSGGMGVTPTPPATPVPPTPLRHPVTPPKPPRPRKPSAQGSAAPVPTQPAVPKAARARGPVVPPRPPRPRKPSAQGSPGVPVTPPPAPAAPFYPPDRPVGRLRAAIRALFAKGSPGVPVTAPVITRAPPARGPVTPPRPARPRKPSAQGSAGAPVTAGTGPTVAGSWSNSYAEPSGFYFPFPAARPVQVAVANTAGDWMIALVTWRQAAAGAGVTISVADDVHNYWEPLGAPSGDSAAAGVTRTAVWYAPAARAAQFVQAAATGSVLSMAVLIIDVNGLSPWSVLTAITPGYANAATALSLGIGAPSAQALMVAALGTDNNTGTITGPGAGWTALPTVSASNGADHTADISLSSAWQVASTAKTAAWSSSGSLDLSGVTAGILVTTAAPAQPNPNWPIVITELDPGAGVTTPPSQITWTPVSARALSMDITQGRQYTLGQLQAGQGTLTIDNPDGALIPPGTGAFAGIDSGTPVRQRMILPGSPTPYYVPFSGFFQRWPFALPGDMLRGETKATILDVWAYASGTLTSMARQEPALDNPYALWPMDDPAGSASAANIASGNASALILTQSKYGNGGGTATFGNSGSALIGDSSAKITTSGQGGGSGIFTQALGSPGNSTVGYALSCTDTGYPPISGGVTIEAWGGVTPPGPVYGVDAAATGSLWSPLPTAPANGQPVILTVATGFTFPGGFSTGTIYYVVNSTSSNFQLAASYGGSPVTVTSDGGCFIQALSSAWHPVIWSARGIKGLVVELYVDNITGALFMQYQTANGGSGTVTIDATRDYRSGGLYQVAVAFTLTTYSVIVQGGANVSLTGSFSSALPASFAEFTMGGVADRGLQGSFMPGNLAFAAIYPQLLPQQRILSHYWAAGAGMADEAASDRIERILEYASLTGRRCILQESITYENDPCVSGRDIGGQPAATSIGNISASTVPAMMYTAPTGDLFYLAKYRAWNQAIKWVLGDNTAGGEIPFLPAQFATDYDPSRVVNDIQLTQLDTSTVTVPSGATSSTTMAAIEAASQAQYGDIPYQQTGYLLSDTTSNYNAGASLGDLANWLANVYAKPKNRVQAVTVSAAASAAGISNPARWAFYAGASVGDMVTVNVRLPTAAVSPLISLTARITQTSRSLQFSQDGTAATITCVLDFAPEYQCLTCDDPVRGLLNGQNVLGW